MNFTYLLKHSAERTYTVSRQYDKKKKLTAIYRASDEIDDENITKALINSDLTHTAPDSVPRIILINDTLFYAWIAYDKGYFLLGPTLFKSHFKMKYNLSDESLSISKDLLSLIPQYPTAMFVEDILMFANISRTGDKTQPFFDEHKILAANFENETPEASISDLFIKIFDNVEEGFIHNPYRHEKRQVDAIERGDTSLLDDILKERFPGRYGSLSQDPVRQEIYIGIVETTLASRAAIKGGLHPETAFYLSDITIQKLDKCHDTITAMNISLDMQRKYAKLVKELKADKKSGDGESNNINISHCKDYIFSHLHDKITVREIAHAIGLDENYLSSLFKNVEGISLKDYIQNEKVTLAKHMLTYSQYSYSEISTYLGFSSQSHFGKVFKKFTGFTPKSYRDNFAAEDFMNDTAESWD